jgi:Bacterial TSP3 repeat
MIDGGGPSAEPGFGNTVDPANKAVANVGQLKRVASAFYIRLAEVDPTLTPALIQSILLRMGLPSNHLSNPTPEVIFPWLTAPLAEDMAPANIGQLKMLFSFDLSTSPAFALDRDSDGLTNLQEVERGTNPQLADTDGDGIRDGREVQLEFNPLRRDTRGNGTDDFDPDDLNKPDVDSDKDGLVNGEDAVPWDTRLHFKKVPESRYAVVPLGPGTPKFINDRNEVVIKSDVQPTGPNAAPQGLRIWSAATGTSRPVVLDAATWPTPLTATDFDNTGRLLISSLTPLLPVPPPQTSTIRYANPSRSIVIENAASASPTVKLLPLYTFPGADLPPLDFGSESGSTAGGLLDNGSVILGTMAFSDGENTGYPFGNVNRSQNGRSTNDQLIGNSWRKIGGAYQTVGAPGDIALTGIPSGYSYSYHSTRTYTSPTDWSQLTDIPPWQDPGDPALGYQAYGVLFNRSGVIVAGHDPSRILFGSPPDWRVDRPLPAPVAYASQKFSTIAPTVAKKLGGPFVGINDMKATECGSGPMIFQPEPSNSGYVWEADPLNPENGDWLPFRFTDPDGSPVYEAIGWWGSHYNSRGEIATFTGLWRNGKSSRWTELVSHPNSNTFVPQGLRMK